LEQVADSDLTRALSALLRELLNGADPVTAWALNPDDPGLFGSLDKLSAVEASTVPPTGGSSIAAHVDHLRYGFELLNRWSRGENPFADANYSASWTRVTVTEAGWKELRERFRAEARTWQENVRQPRTLTNDELNIVVGSVVHLGYHLGAIRQINRATRGPAARD
jgi:DinB superfamily